MKRKLKNIIDTKRKIIEIQTRTINNLKNQCAFQDGKIKQLKYKLNKEKRRRKLKKIKRYPNHHQSKSNAQNNKKVSSLRIFLPRNEKNYNERLSPPPPVLLLSKYFPIDNETTTSRSNKEDSHSSDEIYI